MMTVGSEMLAFKLAAVRQKQVAINATMGAAIALALAVTLLAAAMLADWLLDLNVAIRAVILLVNLAVLGFVGYRYVVKPIVEAPDDEELALFVERVIPDFRTRLIAAVQLTKPQGIPPGGSARLVQALVAETES